MDEVKQFEKQHSALLLFLLIAGMFAINVYAFTRAYNNVERATNRNTLPARVDREEVYPEDKLEEPAEDVSQELDGLLTILEEFTNQQSTPFAIMVTDLSNDEQIAINEYTTFVSASLYKLFVSYEVIRQADIGLIDLNQQTGFDAGGTSVRQCIYNTLSYSDNECGRALRKFIGASYSPNNAIAEAGFYSTNLANDYPITNAHDVNLFFQKIYDQIDFTGEMNDVLLDALKDQQIDNRLPQGLPEGTPIAHKTADLEGYSHDAGIVYSPNGNYIITVLSGPWPNGYTDAPGVIANISTVVYEWFNEPKEITF